MSDEAIQLLPILRSFTRGVLYTWLRGLPPSHCRGVNGGLVAESMEILCENAVNDQVRRHGGRLHELSADDVQRIQSKLLDDIVEVLTCIFYGGAVAA